MWVEGFTLYKASLTNFFWGHFSSFLVFFLFCLFVGTLLQFYFPLCCCLLLLSGTCYNTFSSQSKTQQQHNTKYKADICPKAAINIRVNLSCMKEGVYAIEWATQRTFILNCLLQLQLYLVVKRQRRERKTYTYVYFMVIKANCLGSKSAHQVNRPQRH